MTRCAYWLVEIIDVIRPFYPAFTEALKKKTNLISARNRFIRIRLNDINWPFFLVQLHKKIMVLNFRY
jgi:hypothetical protein